MEALFAPLDSHVGRQRGGMTRKESARNARACKQLRRQRARTAEAEAATVAAAELLGGHPGAPLTLSRSLGLDADGRERLAKLAFMEEHTVHSAVRPLLLFGWSATECNIRACNSLSCEARQRRVNACLVCSEAFLQGQLACIEEHLASATTQDIVCARAPGSEQVHSNACSVPTFRCHNPDNSASSVDTRSSEAGMTPP